MIYAPDNFHVPDARILTPDSKIYSPDHRILSLGEGFALDYDDVLVDFVSGLNIWYNKVHGTNFKYEDYIDWHLWNVWKCTEAEAVDRVHTFHRTDGRNILPVSGAKEGLLTIKYNSYAPHIVTSRSYDIEEITRQHASIHFPEVEQKNIHFADTYGPKKRSKMEILQKLGINILIEDNIDFAIECAQNGIIVILYNRPWNQKPIPDGLPIYRRNDWREIMPTIQSFSH